VYRKRWKFDQGAVRHAEQREASHFTTRDEILRFAQNDVSDVSTDIGTPPCRWGASRIFGKDKYRVK